MNQAQMNYMWITIPENCICNVLLNIVLTTKKKCCLTWALAKKRKKGALAPLITFFE